MSLPSLSSVDAVASAALLLRDVDGQYRPASADDVLQQARRVLSQRVRRGATMSSPQAVKDYLRLQIGTLEQEVFTVVFLDAQHRLIALKEMFRSTVARCAPGCSESLAKRLAAHQTVALQVMLSRNTRVALASLAHVFVQRVFGDEYRRASSAMQFTPQLPAHTLLSWPTT